MRKIKRKLSIRLLRKGALIEETYAAFRNWDLAASFNSNISNIRTRNTIGAANEKWLFEITATFSIRFADNESIEPLVILARAGLAINKWRSCLLWHIGRNSRHISDGDIMVHLALAETGKEFENQASEMRKRSQNETTCIFWTVPVDDAIDRETVEIFRSKEMLSKKGRGPQTRDESALVAEEKIRLRRHEDDLKRLLRQACLSGAVFFRGNDRSPQTGVDSVKKAVESIMANELPEVFHRFGEAAARIRKKDLDSLMTTENLRGLTPVFSSLHLLGDEGGQVVFNTGQNPLSKVFARIKNRTDYGENAGGKYLETEFSKEPFGWEFDTVRLFTVCLLRAGAIAATSKGELIESALSVDAKNTFSNNNLFRQTSFHPKVGIDYRDSQGQ